MLNVTSLTAGMLTLGYLWLTRRVILLRKKEKISLGNGSSEPLLLAIRAHANLNEYAPLALILMALLEVNQSSKSGLLILSAMLLLGRLFHAGALLKIWPGLKFRVLGMALTLGSMAWMAGANLYLALVL